MRTNFALAAGLCLALAAVPALAQGAKGRDYGGPLSVGPNFEKGGQHTPPDYGSKYTKERTTPKRGASKGKATPSKEARTEKASTSDKSPPSAPAPEKGSSTVSSGSVPASDLDTEASPRADTETSTTAAAPTGPTNCKRFDATSGQTITVPCE